MEITHESLHQFVARYAQSDVSIFDSTGRTRTLRDGQPDVWDLVEKADTFLYAGTVYQRAQFAQLIDDAMRPAKVMQVELPPEQKK
jgi:hypothetical protein